MGYLNNVPVAAAAAGQYIQLALDETPNSSPANVAGNTVMSSHNFGAGVFDATQALLIEALFEYAIVSGVGGQTGLWTLSLQELTQIGGTIVTDKVPLNGGFNLTQNGFCKLRFILQPDGAQTYVDGTLQDAITAANTGAGPGIRTFGNSSLTPVVNPVATPLNMALAFQMEITAASAGAGSANVALTNLYTRYTKIGP